MKFFTYMGRHMGQQLHNGHKTFPQGSTLPASSSKGDFPGINHLIAPTA
jgi:hypothetical protein